MCFLSSKLFAVNTFHSWNIFACTQYFGFTNTSFSSKESGLGDRSYLLLAYLRPGTLFVSYSVACTVVI